MKLRIDVKGFCYFYSMIPLLTVNEEYIDSNWETKESADWVKDYCSVMMAGGKIPVYQCDNNWVRMGVFVEYKDVDRDFHEYGYCDTEESLVKYLKKYVEDGENNYFVEVGGMSMDYEKYYKNGSYINKDGVDTGRDYYDYIDENPDMKTDQDVEGRWFTFVIYKLK